ncbi:uncharacterized protein LOC121877410 isoform X2 [Homarus americanus]|nr:uncharacterized protein LOC121877410 isoform X2 [Homarus americanus]XP_042239099.1 uncharacterized protein LOC121877410 isoform X2 [Homarus americanus]XP_042239100.1 uncharacterized protein LOC121877410 isoform X2 [Homarus americanus]XP_042239101.1 uncharacterized protein LOC121877410 isoform X2 [Homarus americanus]
MSKKIEDSELQTLTLSPTNTNDDESSPFVNPASDETSFPISPPPSFSTVTTSSTEPPGEKRKLERMVSVPGTGANTNKPLPTLRVSTPPSTTQITYTNEESNERKIDLSKICRERPTPGNSIGQKKDLPRQTDYSLPFPSHVVSGNKGFQISKSDSKTRVLEKGLTTSSHRSQLARGDFKRPGTHCGQVSGINPTASYTQAASGSAPSTPHSFGITISAPPSRVGTNNKGNSGSKAWLGRPVVRSGLRMRGGLDSRQMDRPIQHHTFLADVADVRQIEQGLLQLMEDFQAGNLRAFGKDSRLRQMEAIREQQERLARLHFDVGAEQDLFPPLSEEGLRTSHDNMRTLMEKLAQLSESIERLHTNTSSERKTSSNERKCSSNQRATENVGHSKFHSGAWNQQMPDGHHSSDQHGNYGHMNNNAQHTSPANSRLGHGQHSTNRLRNSAGNPMSGIMKSGKLADS